LVSATAVVVLLGIGVGVAVKVRSEKAESSATRVESSEQSAIDTAKRVCIAGDCEAAHAALEAAVAESSPLRGSPDFKEVENQWADQLLSRAETLSDITKRRVLYQRVSQSIYADSARRSAAADMLQQLDTSTLATSPTQVSVVEAPRPSDSAAPSLRSNSAPKTLPGVAKIRGPATTPSPSPTPAPSTATASSGSVDDRERRLALRGTSDAKILLKQQLEERVFGGDATDNEIRLLIGTCKDVGDATCVQRARAVLAQKQSN
jgi:hypothetical protein